MATPRLPLHGKRRARNSQHIRPPPPRAMTTCTSWISTAPFLAKGFTACSSGPATDPHCWYYTNLEDPNGRGYDALRRLFLIEMATALSVPARDFIE